QDPEQRIDGEEDHASDGARHQGVRRAIRQSVRAVRAVRARKPMSDRSSVSKVLIACVGGFLGAGKTPALVAAARELIKRGLRVGIITNDQGGLLVDTEVMRDLGLPAEEITGGCFCC